jgi:hypothetical protein
MSPAEQAAAVYEREECARTFREDLEAHLIGGYVFSTPTVFLMARPVRHDAPQAEIVNPWHVFPREECDCWMLYLAAGDIAEFFRWVPFPLAFVAWERNNVLRTYYAKTVEKKCTRSRSFFSSLPSSVCGPSPKP